MKRMIVIAAVVTVFCATTVFAQAGPERDDNKPKADTTSVKKAKEKSKPASAEKGKKPEKPEKAEEAKKLQEPEKPEKPMSSPESGVVPRAVFATAIVEREPIETVDTLTTAVDSVYFFTTIVGMDGQTVTHRWKHGEDVLAEVPISIGASHWRAYSKKRLLPAWTGKWTVEVVGPAGDVLMQRSFVYVTD